MSIREILNFNTDWLFIPEDIQGGEKESLDVQKFETVHLPHTNIELPHHFFKEQDYQFVSWYRRHFVADENWHGKRIWIDFNGAMSVAKVYINGHYLGENKGGYVPFSFDVTDYLSFTGENVIAVRLDSSKRMDVPPEGDVVDYMLFGGIYRDVYLRIVHPVSIERTFITTPGIRQEAACVVMETEVRNQTKGNCIIEIKASIVYKDQFIGSVSSEQITIDAEGIAVVTMKMEDLKEPKIWGIDEPNLYKTVFTLLLDGEEVDQYEQVFGIRHIEFKEDGKFYLNGQALKLRGLNRHQMFPYVGQAMGNRMQRRDAEILKYDLGLNFVRTSHYPQAPAFLERCDEIGLLVLEELPGWQHIGNKAWKEIAKDHLAKMIQRDCNHPSIFLWGVRINESPDDHDFYTETNELAKRMDPSRPTGGVRNLEKSEFLEDVYTYNDFQFNLEGKLKMPTHTPTLVTEYMGHMFPTRRYDNDTRLMQHAEKHAAIQNVSYGVPELAGACGWCAFDYNTHVNFGSGDRICYHGVMDIFRIPKYAAYFYQSQRDVQYGITLFIARRLVPSINEDGGKVITVYSNCEQVEVIVKGKSLGMQKPNRILYPNLPHPPFVFNQGLPWPYGGDSVIRAVGYIDGKPVGEHVLRMEGEPHHIQLVPDHSELVADGGDMTRVLVQAVDQHNQPLSLGNFAIQLKVEGEGQLVGENPLIVEGGQAAIYIRTTRKAGIITVRAENTFLQSAEIKINSVPLLEK
jgi:beta-galactosidase